MARGNWGQSDLGEAEDRLRNQLALEGRVPVELEGPNPTIVPVIIVGDGTRPGMGRSRDRRFSIGKLWTAMPSGTTAIVQAQLDVVIDNIVICFDDDATTSTLIVQMGYYPPNTALPVPPTTATNPFLDRGLGDTAPVLVGAGAAVIAAGNLMGEVDLVQQAPHLVVPLGFMLMQGASFALRGVVGGTGSWSVFGMCRTF